MDNPKPGVLFHAIVASIIATVIEFFNGAIQYPVSPDQKIPPVWIQMIILFLINMAIFAAAFYLIKAIYTRIKRK